MQGATTSPAAAEVQRLIDSGQCKVALRVARDHHRQQRSADTASLVMAAYLARGTALFEQGLQREAGAVLDVLAEQFPEVARRHREPYMRLAGRLGRLEPLLGPLADPDLEDEHRAQIEQVLREQLTDPRVLADTSLLPPEHPVRVAAGAVARALAAVTTGGAGDEQISLREVSHRSPLAPWKLLVRAIALLYRHDADGCRACLKRIDPAARPARLVPLLGVLLGDSPNTHLARPLRRLCQRLRPVEDPLHKALAALDARFAKEDSPSRLRKAIADAVGACARDRPDLLDTLRQHIAVKATTHGVPPGPVRRGLGGPPLRTAAFWRLFARALEGRYDPDPFVACAAWEQFRRHAIHEGWFEPDAPEVAAIYQRMAAEIERIPDGYLTTLRDDFLEEFDGFAREYRDQPSEVQALAPRRRRLQDAWFTDATEIYRRAAAIAPSASLFERWMACAQRPTTGGTEDDAAEAWHEAAPADVRPLLHLMASAERRGALKKACGYLDRAQALDGVNAAVRQARLRLWSAIAMRHIANGQLHLARKDLSAAPDPSATDAADHAAIVAAVAAVLHEAAAPGQTGPDGDVPAAAAARTEAAARLGSDGAAAMLIEAVRVQCIGKAERRRRRLKQARPSGSHDLLADVIRAARAARSAGIAFTLQAPWHAPLIKTLTCAEVPVEAVHLAQLASLAAEQGCDRLAYAAAGAGLRRPDAAPAAGHLLLARARSLPTDDDRFQDCLRAAAALARRQRDEGLGGAVARAAAARLQQPWAFDGDDLLTPMEASEVESVLERERRAMRFPRRAARRPWDAMPGTGDFPPSTCRDEGTWQLELPFEDEADPPTGFDEIPAPIPHLPGIPPKLIPLIGRLMAEYGIDFALGCNPDEFDRIDPDLKEQIIRVLEEWEGDGPRPQRRKPARRRRRRR